MTSPSHLPPGAAGSRPRGAARAALIVVAALAVVLSFGGCALARPAYISCKGGGEIEQTFNVLGYAQSLKVSAKCPDGFEYEQGAQRAGK